MPDITNPPHPRPKKKPTGNGNNIYYDAEETWQVGTPVYYYYDTGSYGAVLDGIILMGDSSSIDVEDGVITAIS